MIDIHVLYLSSFYSKSDSLSSVHYLSFSGMTSTLIVTTIINRQKANNIMKIYIKSGDKISSESKSGHLKETNIEYGIEDYTHYHRVLNYDWNEIPVRLIETDADIIHPETSEILNVVFKNIDAKSEDFGMQYLANVRGWKLHKIKFIFEQHSFQFLASGGFWIILIGFLLLLFR